MLRDILSGKKTYIVAGFLALKALLTLIGVLPGDVMNAIQELLVALGLSSVRAGISKIGL